MWIKSCLDSIKGSILLKKGRGREGMLKNKRRCVELSVETGWFSRLAAAEQNGVLYAMKLCLYFNEGAMLIPLVACSRAFLPSDEGEVVFPFRANGTEPRLNRDPSPCRSKLTNKFALHLCICKF